MSKEKLEHAKSVAARKKIREKFRKPTTLLPLWLPSKLSSKCSVAASVLLQPIKKEASANEGPQKQVKMERSYNPADTCWNQIGNLQSAGHNCQWQTLLCPSLAHRDLLVGPSTDKVVFSFGWWCDPRRMITVQKRPHLTGQRCAVVGSCVWCTLSWSPTV